MAHVYSSSMYMRYFFGYPVDPLRLMPPYGGCCGPLW